MRASVARHLLMLRERLVAVRERIRAIPVASIAASTLLLLESVATFPFFLVSWIVNGIFFSILAGYQMGKADSGAKRNALLKLLGSPGRDKKP